MVPEWLSVDAGKILGEMLLREGAESDDSSVEFCSRMRGSFRNKEEECIATMFCLNTETDLDTVDETVHRTLRFFQGLDAINMNPLVLNRMADKWREGDVKSSDDQQ
jgi:hypothetical protein